MNGGNTGRSVRSYVAALFIAAFVLNWVWEMLQMPAYVEMADRPWGEALGICTLATLGDVVVTWAIYGIGTLAAGQLRWGMSSKWNIYATGALLGGLAAVGIEWKALAAGHWSYNDRMPIVPVLGVGLWPLVQLTILAPLAFGVAAWWSRRADQPCCR